MLWLKKLHMKLHKRSFANIVMFHCNRLIYELLEDDNSDARKSLQGTIGNHCFDLIREKGSQEINDFKKILIETISGIVQSDNPFVSMRKELIYTIHSNALNRIFLSEKYVGRREELYEFMNQSLSDSDITHSDETASIMYFWSEARSCILRMLQHTHFEKASKDDWFSRYSKAYTTYVEMFFDISLKQKDGIDLSLEIDSVTFPVAKKVVEQFQQQLTGEVIGV